MAMKIGLTYTGSPEKHRNYANWLQGGSSEIEIVTLSSGGDADAIRQCDALVISGGVDIHPKLYGGDLQYQGRPAVWEEDRDLFEREVLEFALEHKMPVLGICRGLQLINVCLKGTLIQDLGRTGDETHEAVGNKDKWHSVQVEEGTILAAIADGVRFVGEKDEIGERMNVAEGEANSAHHQAIDQLGEGLRVNCRAADGTIEGIEWRDPDGKSFLLGVQWHPERMADPVNPLTAMVREAFVKNIPKEK
jgi:putative glutamine amidotransferase